MNKHGVYLLAPLLAISASQAFACEGNSRNSCNGLVNTCTSEGLCVIDASSGNCCSLSKVSRSNNCVSSEDANICEVENGVSYVKNVSQPLNDTASVPVVNTPSPTAWPTSEPTSQPTKSPTSSPTYRPTSLSPTNAPTTSFSPTETCYNIEIGLIFDQYPDETKWEITKGRRNSIENSNANILKESPYYDPNQGYTEASEKHIVCLPKGKYTYTILDSNKDGMCCRNGEGRYAVTYQETGEIITRGSEFDQFESTTFQIPFVAPQLRDSDGDGIEDRTKNVVPPIILTSNGLPDKCDNEFGLHLKTDDYGVETTWELRERSTTGSYEDGKVVVSGGPYTSDFTYDISYCLYPGKYTFVFYDWQCDGLTGNEMTGHYVLRVNGNEIHRGGTTMDKYWEEVKLEFKKDIESVAVKARTGDLSMDESSGGTRKSNLMHIVTMAVVALILA